MAGSATRIPEIIEQNEATLLADWITNQSSNVRRDLIKDRELREQCQEFVRLLKDALKGSDLTSMRGPKWEAMRHFLSDVSNSRIALGFSNSETAMFIFSFKHPLFAKLRKEYARDTDRLSEETWFATELLDQLGLWTIEAFQKNREAVIIRQQQDMLELSTPVVKLWDGILALPIIGTLDSARSQVVMEALLTTIVQTGSAIAIIDITGVPTVDTLTAQHLLKTVTAARLMGAECIISGIRPQIAQTIVHLGVDLNAVLTKASLRDAFAVALERNQMAIIRTGKAKAQA